MRQDFETAAYLISAALFRVSAGGVAVAEGEADRTISVTSVTRGGMHHAR